MSPVVEERLAEVEQLCREHHVARLELFGSAADGRFRPGESDLDFLVTFGPKPDSKRGFNAPYFTLVAALEDLFETSVDLVEESAIRNPYFRQGVDIAPKVLLYAAPGAPASVRPAAPHPAPECSPAELRTKKLLYDMRQEAAAIGTFTAGKTIADYEQDLMLHYAVERSFEIIGGAAARLVRHDPAAAARISGHRDIIGFRNVIAHEYDNLDSEEVWKAITDDIPTLLRETEALLAEKKQITKTSLLPRNQQHFT